MDVSASARVSSDGSARVSCPRLRNGSASPAITGGPEKADSLESGRCNPGEVCFSRHPSGFQGPLSSLIRSMTQPKRPSTDELRLLRGDGSLEEQALPRAGHMELVSEGSVSSIATGEAFVFWMSAKRQSGDTIW